MILDAYESPTRSLSYVVPFISNFEVFYVKIYRTLQSFHTDNLAIRASLGMRIDACKSSTLKLSHLSKFEPKFALVADLLVFEDRRHFPHGHLKPLLFVSRKLGFRSCRTMVGGAWQFLVLLLATVPAGSRPPAVAAGIVSCAAAKFHRVCARNTHSCGHAAML